jgi:hypothetical protein
VKTLELLQLGRIEKGSLTMDLKYKSLSACWLGSKTNKGSKDDNADAADDNTKYIQRDSLITLSVTRGKTTTLEHYHVLAIFSKHYNKWLVHWDQDSVVYQEGSKKFKVLERMVVKDGSRWREVELEEDGKWGPKFVFSIKSMSEIVRVDGDLTAGFLNY